MMSTKQFQVRWNFLKPATIMISLKVVEMRGRLKEVASNTEPRNWNPGGQVMQKIFLPDLAEVVIIPILVTHLYSFFGYSYHFVQNWFSFDPATQLSF